jgi:hypothetical protein
MKYTMAVLALVLVLAGCEESATTPPNSAVFVVEVVEGETFRILLQDEDRISEARERLASAEAMVVHGELARGTGGFNTEFSGHLKPATVTFVDVAMELCDGRPSYVESELEYYLESVKFYCPWGVTIIAEQ